MRFATVCSGIEACSAAWEPLGWESAWFSEIDKFPSAVLAHHYPNTPNLGDMTKILQDERTHQPIDVFCGGTPCQSFSVAGLRKGLDDPRGNLALEYLRIIDKIRPRWIIWENVPGVLSSNGGRDFGAFIGGLGELGYGISYRVLDAQHFGVPQRRRRVFVVGHSSGDWRRAAAVLFERERLSRDSSPRRKEREDVACFTSGSIGGYNKGVGTLRANGGDIGGDSESLIVPSETFPTLDAHYSKKWGSNQWVDNGQYVISNAEGSEGFPFLTASNIGKTVNNQTPLLYSIMPQTRVRRLTPIECERLQGFPDNYTQIPYTGKAAEYCPDGPRYKGLGNSMAVPVMRWLGERIEFVESVMDKS